ncbi:MAG: FkbM family methyltransferase, partial [Comamonadaceae bacterium]
MAFVSYAQNFEDVMLWRALRSVQRGFYIDVGAQSPDLDSVTRAFSDAGWRGINVEPHPGYHADLLERRPRDINLRCALGDRPGIATIHLVGATGLSTLDQSIAGRHVDAGYAIERTQVDVETLDAVWD